MEMLADGSNDISMLLAKKIGAHEVQVGEVAVIEALRKPGGKADGVAV